MEKLSQFYFLENEKIMKNSLKFLLLSLVGITALTSTTYSYDLVQSSQYPRWNPANKSTDRSLLCYGRSYKNIYSSNGGCSSWDPLLLSWSFYTQESFQFYKDIGYYWLNTANNGEWLDIYYSQWNNQTRKQSYKIFSIPSRAWYQYTNTIGNTFVFTKMFFYPFQFTFYDPETRYSVSFLNKMKLENIILLSDPSRDDNNVRMINLQKLKAWSRSASRSEAVKILIGDITPADIKAMQWTTSYTMVEWGGSFHPPLFRVDKQWSAWWIYTEDFELDTNIWNTWGSNTPNQGNNSGNSNQSYDQSLAEYNQCVWYRQNVKTYTTYDRECYRSLLDSAPLTGSVDHATLLQPWQSIVDWDGVSELNLATNDPICQKFKGRKQAYKEKLGNDWDKFLKDAQDNRLTPSGIDPKLYCGDRPKRNSNWGAGLIDSIKVIWWNRWKKIGSVNGEDIEQNDFEKLFWLYVTYQDACKKRKYMPTKYDWWKSNILFYDYFFNNKNNVNVCKYAEELWKRIEDKYWNAVFSTGYQANLNNDLQLNSQLVENINVFKNTGTIDFNLLSGVIATLTGTVNDPLDPSRIFDFFAKDYKDGFDRSFWVLWYQSCWEWLGLDQWDYIVYFPLIFILFKFVRWRI